LKQGSVETEGKKGKKEDWDQLARIVVSTKRENGEANRYEPGEKRGSWKEDLTDVIPMPPEHGETGKDKKGQIIGLKGSGRGKLPTSSRKRGQHSSGEKKNKSPGGKS